jgi:hypothetical protein
MRASTESEMLAFGFARWQWPLRAGLQ